MRIADGMSCLPAKYSQSATAIDLKRMILTAAPFYPRLPAFSTKLADLPMPELSHQKYQKLDWYGKIISFLLDDPITFDNLSPTKKKTVKQASVKYRVSDQHLFYIERNGETAKCSLPYENPFNFKEAHNKHGHFWN